MKKIFFATMALLVSLVLVACQNDTKDYQALLETYKDQFQIDSDLSDDILNVPSTISVDGIGLVSITYSTNPSGVISSNGVITRGDEDVTVEVTVNFKYEHFETSRTFNILITKKPVLKFTVTFDSKGGSLVSPIEVESNQTITKPQDPTREGYHFIGWFYGNDPFSFSTPITANFTLEAKWEEVEVIEFVTVTFETNGGSALEPKEVQKGYLLTIPKDPVKNGFDFIGWSISNQEYIAFDFETPITTNLTLYAFYGNLDTYEVVVDGETYMVKEGKTLPEITPQFIVGKVFIGYLLNGETFDITQPIYQNLVIVSEYRDAYVFELTLELNGGVVEGNIVESYYEYEEILLPTPTKEGYVFVGWYIDNDFNQIFTSSKLTMDLTLYAKFVDENDPAAQLEVGAYFESIYATWVDADPSSASVSYRISGTEEWITVDQQLVRKLNTTKARVDIVGLKEGLYDIKITTSSQTILTSNEIFTERHDRSGYAHFNFTEGIGGYLDDGTLKPDAIVVYVTEENKNQITIPGIGQVGLGWILNNNQYQSNASNTYNPSAYVTSIATFNKPLVFRFIGRVTVPEGATIYNSTNQGGSVGDNGNMVRIKNANHMTLEGIGEDAVIDGWGFHFIASTSNRGIGFEVRNLTFKNYAEDAIGMEGTDTVPARRAWWHNLTFYSGYHPNPAESDKAYGDGAADFKRGEYLTLSYSVFDGAHKTNLIGATSTDKTYHITMHHNLWRNNTSRIPLTRRANIHMYNNVIETTDNNQNEISYAQNPRLDAYIFSEANYFQGTKNPSTIDQGAIKSYGDIKYSTYGDDDATVVQSRSQTVASNNLYPNFDTNPSVFYYDAVNQRSNVYKLTDAVTARADVYAYSGVYRKFAEPEKVKIHNTVPQLISQDVTQPEVKINKGQPLLVFTILVKADFTLVTTSTGIQPVLVSIYGEPILKGNGSIELEPGTYVVESEQARGASKGSFQGKESKAGYTITLDSSAASLARINRAKEAIDAIPDVVEYTSLHLELIQTARMYHDELTTSEKLEVSDQKITDAYDTYVLKGKTYIEGLIDEIGTVTEYSLPLITSARSAYDDAISDVKEAVTNLADLIFKEATFENFKVEGLNQYILGLPNITNIGIIERAELEDVKLMYEEAYSIYESLTSEQKSGITDIDKITNGLELLEEKLIPHTIKDFIDALVLDEITRQNGVLIPTYYHTYIEFSEEQLSILTIEDMSKLEAAYEIYLDLQGIVYEWIPEFNTNTDNFFTYVGDTFINNAGTFNIYGQDLTLAGKLNSNATLSFTTTSPNTTLVLYVKTRTTQTQGKLDIDGVIYDLDTLYNEQGIAYIEVTLSEAKTYIIKRNNRELALYYVEVRL